MKRGKRGSLRRKDGNCFDESCSYLSRKKGGIAESGQQPVLELFARCPLFPKFSSEESYVSSQEEGDRFEYLIICSPVEMYSRSRQISQSSSAEKTE